MMCNILINILTQIMHLLEGSLNAFFLVMSSHGELPLDSGHVGFHTVQLSSRSDGILSRSFQRSYSFQCCR